MTPPSPLSPCRGHVRVIRLDGRERAAARSHGAVLPCACLQGGVGVGGATPRAQGGVLLGRGGGCPGLGPGPLGPCGFTRSRAAAGPFWGSKSSLRSARAQRELARRGGSSPPSLEGGSGLSRAPAIACAPPLGSPVAMWPSSSVVRCLCRLSSLDVDFRRRSPVGRNPPPIVVVVAACRRWLLPVVARRRRRRCRPPSIVHRRPRLCRRPSSAQSRQWGSPGFSAGNLSRVACAHVCLRGHGRAPEKRIKCTK